MKILKNNKGFSLLELLIVVMIMLCLVAPGIVGFGMNIYKLTQCDFEAPYKAEIIRGVGIPVFFVGAIAGYCDINDGKVQN